MLRLTLQRSAPACRAAFARSGGLRCLATHYAESHEYVKVDGETGTVGITDYAANALGDIVFVDLPEVGDEVEKGESFGPEQPR